MDNTLAWLRGLFKLRLLQLFGILKIFLLFGVFTISNVNLTTVNRRRLVRLLLPRDQYVIVLCFHGSRDAIPASNFITCLKYI